MLTATIGGLALIALVFYVVNDALDGVEQDFASVARESEEEGYREDRH